MSRDDERVQRVVTFFEELSPADLARLGSIYGADAYFQDPFNVVQGMAAIESVFAHMFATLDEPRFVIRDVVAQGDQCCLTWEFHFRMKRFARAAQTIRGATHLRFGTDGRIAVHRDYWDAAQELYETLPILGALMRWLRRRGAAVPVQRDRD